jgi:hypothetical protein
MPNIWLSQAAVVAASVAVEQVDTETLLSVKQLVVAVLLKANFHL